MCVDRVLATLGEGTFGKVVKVKDVTKSRYNVIHRNDVVKFSLFCLTHIFCSSFSSSSSSSTTNV